MKNEDQSIKVDTVASTTGEGNTFVVSLSDTTKAKLNEIDNLADNKLNKTLDNLDPKGKEVIAGLVNGEAVGNYITVENETTESGKKIKVGLNVADDLAQDDVAGKVASADAVKNYTQAQLAEQTISYKANSGTAKTVKLADGLNFTNGTNTTAKVGDNGEVSFSVNPTLTGMESISGKGTTLAFTDEGISLGGKKLLN